MHATESSAFETRVQAQDALFVAVFLVYTEEQHFCLLLSDRDLSRILKQVEIHSGYQNLYLPNVHAQTF